MAVVMSGLGAIGGFAAGLLGIGGGIIMLPLMLYVPPIFGLPILSVKGAAALTMVQSLFAALSGIWVHRRRGGMDWRLAVYLGLSGATASLAGSWSSQYLQSDIILGLFAMLTVIATGLMFLDPAERDGTGGVSRILSVAGGFCIGGAAGIVGQGGAFLFVPFMIFVLRIPTRTALGSSLVISALSGIAGFAGRAGTGQIDYFLASALVLGAIPAAQLGGWLSSKLHTVVLRRVLGVVIGITAIRMLVGISAWYLAGLALAVTILITTGIFQRNKLFCPTAGSDASPE